VISNPFVRLESNVRFSIFALCLAVGTLMSLRNRKRKLTNGMKWIVASFIFFYALAIVRMNVVQIELASNYETLVYQYALLSLFCFCASSIFYAGFSERYMAWAIFAAAFPCCIVIILNFEELNNYLSAATFRLGNLSYNEYQNVSIILAFGSISALCCINLKKQETILRSISTMLFNASLLSLSALFGSYVFLGIARGEAIAFVSAVLIYLSPRIAMLLVPFSYVGISFVANNLESPFAQRMLILLDGGLDERQFIYSLAWSLPMEVPSILLFGGGLNYFQFYYGYSFGLYPHNVYLESLITGGIGMFIVVLFLFVIPALTGIFRSLKYPRLPRSIALSFVVFVALVSAKSGTIAIFWSYALFVCSAFYVLFDLKYDKTRVSSI
jgi:hypothetical protein